MGIEYEDALDKCDYKATYKTLEEAEAAAMVAAWQYDQDKHTHLEAYKCRDCKLYHLATKHTDV